MCVDDVTLLDCLSSCRYCRCRLWSYAYVLYLPYGEIIYLCISCVPVAMMKNAMVKEVSRRKGLFLTLVLEGESLMWGSYTPRSRKLRDHIIFNCKHKSGRGCETSKSASFDLLPPARPRLWNLPTHCHWLGIKCSNTWTDGGYFPQTSTPSVVCSM